MSCNLNLLDNSGPELAGLPGRPLIAASGASTTCFIDRWWGYRGGATGYMIANAGGDGYPNQIVMSRNTGDASTAALVIGQSTGIAANGLSTIDVVLRSLNRFHSGLAAQTLVFSIYARAGGGFSGSDFTLEIVTAFSDVNICSGAWTVEASATFPRIALFGGFWRRFQVTLSLLPGRPVLGVRVRFNDSSGTAVADDTLYLTGAKLELSATGAATEYVMPTVHESLQLQAVLSGFWRKYGRNCLRCIRHREYGSRADVPVSRRDD
jgi:hypothetical protein